MTEMATLAPVIRRAGEGEKRWFFGEKRDRWIGFVIEGLNVTGSKEVLSRSCREPGNCRDEDIGPIIVPSIGVEGAL